MNWEAIHVPTLLIDEGRARANIRRMAAKARASGIPLRPHFKTHQSAEIGEWFRAEGITTITASSIRMAAYFADHGWHDITVAFPVNWRELDAIRALARRVKLGLVVESPETAVFLRDHLTEPVDVWIEVDTGYPRTGVEWDAPAAAVTIAQTIRAADHLNLRGLLTHRGSSYACRGADQLRAFWDETVSRVNRVRDALVDAGFSGLAVSSGDTPCSSAVERFEGVDEVRPGNFVYYDWMQALIGSCAETDIAVAVACPVVSKNAARSQIAVYGGAVHLSKDSTVDHAGRTTFGAVAFPTESGWGGVLLDTYVRGLSQEHGILQADAGTFDQVRIGDLLIVLPVHSCLTADLLKSGTSLSGATIDMLVLNA